MRKNIFLHFMNRDTREIFRVFELLDSADHAAALRKPLNAAAILCEDACYAPPGFVIEEDLAFELFETQSAYLETGLVQLPIRERSLVDYAEKKRGEYAPTRNRYSGLFDDSRLELLSSHEAAITSRKVQIGPAIAEGFAVGVDSRARVWKTIREKATPRVIRNLREVPTLLAENGKPLTWSMMEPLFLEESKPFYKEARDALQHVYFSEYCREHKLILLSDVPYMPEVFYLPSDRSVYSYRRFRNFLASLGCADLFLEASAKFIIRMRSSIGFVELIDAYVALADIYKAEGDFKYQTRRAVEAARFDWIGLGERRKGILDDPSRIEALEIDDACAELAKILSSEHNLPERAKQNISSDRKSNKIRTKENRMKVAVFVALEEELEVLAKQLDLTRQAGRPSAIGKIGEVELEVLCPRAMGRVAAAVEMSRYLSEAKPKPSLVLCVGLAGGFVEAKIDAGTVICAQTVVDLANRKVKDDEGGNAESKFRRQDFECSREVYSVATSDEFDLSGWVTYCSENFDWPKGRVPSLREGKIASVDEVVSSDDHRKKMVENVDKLLGVEMEAGGVCAAAKSFGIPVAVLRVVSDMADPSKEDDQWRSIGMKTLAQLISRLPMKRIIELEQK
ncbi:MAG: hypothetical protein COC12_09365 [Rhodobacteraceae bacterium]|nr:MAG: hypothetical protein COC12_09365 [Paracoccaceae bacterium]